MTEARTDALALAVDILEDVDQGASDRGTSPERLAEVRELARFILGEEETEEVEEVDAEEPEEGRLNLREGMPNGPAYRVQCAATPGDYAYTRSGKSGNRPFVYVEATADGETRAVALDVAEARAFAAAILNAADDAEGASPLLMFQPSPEDAE